MSTSSSHPDEKWLEDIDVKETVDSRRFYRYLGLETFKRDEIQEKFRLIESKCIARDIRSMRKYFSCLPYLPIIDIDCK